MRVEVVPREDVELARVVVVVAAALDGAATDEVLEHAGDGILAPALVVGEVFVAPGGLHAARVLLGEVAVGGGVLAHGPAQTRVDDVGANIHLRPEVDSEARGAPGATDVVAGLLPDVGVEGRGQAVGIGDVIELVGVGGVHVGDAVLVVLLAPFLDGIDPGDVGGIGVDVGVRTGDARAHAVGEDGHGVVVERRRHAREPVVPHERENLVGGERGREGGGAVGGRLAPVLEEVELAVAV